MRENFYNVRMGNQRKERKKEGSKNERKKDDN